MHTCPRSDYLMQRCFKIKLRGPQVTLKFSNQTFPNNIYPLSICTFLTRAISNVGFKRCVPIIMSMQLSDVGQTALSKRVQWAWLNMLDILRRDLGLVGLCISAHDTLMLLNSSLDTPWRSLLYRNRHWTKDVFMDVYVSFPIQCCKPFGSPASPSPDEMLSMLVVLVLVLVLLLLSLLCLSAFGCRCRCCGACVAFVCRWLLLVLLCWFSCCHVCFGLGLKC